MRTGVRLFLLGTLLIALHVQAQPRVPIQQEVPSFPDLPLGRDPDTPKTSRVITVDCNNGGSLDKILRDVLRDTTVLVTGTCHETVAILGAREIIIDGQNEAVIDATDSKEPAILVAGGHSVTIRAVTVVGGVNGIQVTKGAQKITIEDVITEKSLSHGFLVNDRSSVRIFDSQALGSGDSGLDMNGFSQVTIGSVPGNADAKTLGSGDSDSPVEGPPQAMMYAPGNANSCQSSSYSEPYSCTGLCVEDHFGACAISVNSASNLLIRGGVTLSGGGAVSSGVCLSNVGSRIDSASGSNLWASNYHKGVRIGAGSTLAIHQCAHVELRQNSFGIDVGIGGTLEAADTCGASQVYIADSMVGVFSSGTSMFSDVAVSGNNVNLLLPVGGGFIPSGCSNFGTCWSSSIGTYYCQ